MKVKLLIIVLAAMALQIPARAAISVDQTMTEEYLRNNGYSKQLFDTVNVSRARALGEEYYSSEEINFAKKKAPVRWWRRFHAHLDPALDDYSYYHHDNNPEPTISDF